MAERKTLHTVTASIIGVATVLWLLALGGVGSGLLSDDPEPPELNPYAARSTDDADAGPAVFAVTAVDFDGGFVMVSNVGGSAGSPGGMWLCNRPSYFGVPDVTLQPGESVAVFAGDEGALPDGAVAAAAGNIGSITPSGGEMGLYTSSSFGDSGAIVSYVEWGSSGHGRSTVAVDAGIWTDGGFVDATGASSIVAPAGASDPSGWSAG